MGREIRKVSKDWIHPKTEPGKYIPLFAGLFAEEDAEWMLGWEKWQQGLRKNYREMDKWEPIDTKHKHLRYSEYAGERPSPDDYMPVFPEADLTHIMMYETCTEGTPISPAFEKPEDLAHWLADNNASAFGSMTATYEQWLTTCREGWAPSAVRNATGFHSGVEALAEKK